MYKCEYCGRHLKKKYDKCPGCGSNDFKKLQNVGEIIIKEPPKDGYVVNLENFKHKRKEHRGPFLVGVYMVGAFLLFFALFISIASSYVIGTEMDIFLFIFIIFVIIFVIAGITNSKSIFSMSKNIRDRENNNIKKVKYLSKNGM